MTKGITITIENEAKEKRDGFLGLLLINLGARLLGNLLASKSLIRAGEGNVCSAESFDVVSSLKLLSK